MTHTSLALAGLTLALITAPACAPQAAVETAQGDNQAHMTKAQPNAGDAPALPALPAGAQRLEQAVDPGPDALTLRGAIRMDWGADNGHDVAYVVRGTPAQTPTSYAAYVSDGEDSAQNWTRLTYEPEWRRLTIETPSGAAGIAHNPDGTYSVAGKAFEGLLPAAEALAKAPGLAPMTQALFVAGVIAVADAAKVASPRIPDGWCDPNWCHVDPDCIHGCGGPGFAPVAAPFACARWGDDSPACGSLQDMLR